MFILRRITSNGIESNTSLGEHYILITKERNPEEFKQSMKDISHDEDDIFGFVSQESIGKIEMIPLYKKSFYYIMASNGQTFANITLK